MRILVHAGFYKTGTTSLQSFLARNRATLAPAFDYYGPGDFKSAGALARIYAQRPFPWRMHRFRRAFRQFLQALPDPASGVLVLSRENFSGAMPGHRDWRGRPLRDIATAAIPLTRTVCAELHRRFGADAQIDLLYTTRNRDAWLASVHGHLLRSIALSEDLDTFRAGFARFPSLESEAARIARALAPIPVHTAALEDLTGRPHGPASALLDLAAVPPSLRARLAPAPPANTGQPAALRAEFLALNRQGLSRAALKQAKQALLDAANPGRDG